VSSGRLRLPYRYLVQIGERDRWRCHVCGEGYRAGPDFRWEVEHDIAVTRGGRNLLQNLRLSHRRCNREKGTA
jgi:5-methylcytosine-specific restriction endonuclease McrA